MNNSFNISYPIPDYPQISSYIELLYCWKSEEANQEALKQMAKDDGDVDALSRLAYIDHRIMKESFAAEMRAKLLDIMRDPTSSIGVKKAKENLLIRLCRAEKGLRPAAGRPRHIEDELAVVLAKAIHTTFEAQKIKEALKTKKIGEIFHEKKEFLLKILIPIETKALENDKKGYNRVYMDDVEDNIELNIKNSEPLDFAVMVLVHMYEETEDYVKRKLGKALIDDLTGPLTKQDEQRILDKHKLKDIYSKTINYGKNTPPSSPGTP